MNDQLTDMNASTIDEIPGQSPAPRQPEGEDPPCCSAPPDTDPGPPVG
jgi:hypothetical protein